MAGFDDWLRGQIGGWGGGNRPSTNIPAPGQNAELARMAAALRLVQGQMGGGAPSNGGSLTGLAAPIPQTRWGDTLGSMNAGGNPPPLLPLGPPIPQGVKDAQAAQMIANMQRSDRQPAGSPAEMLVGNPVFQKLITDMQATPIEAMWALDQVPGDEPDQTMQYGLATSALQKRRQEGYTETALANPTTNPIALGAASIAGFPGAAISYGIGGVDEAVHDPLGIPGQVAGAAKDATMGFLDLMGKPQHFVELEQAGLEYEHAKHPGGVKGALATVGHWQGRIAGGVAGEVLGLTMSSWAADHPDKVIDAYEKGYQIKTWVLGPGGQPQQITLENVPPGRAAVVASFYADKNMLQELGWQIISDPQTLLAAGGVAGRVMQGARVAEDAGLLARGAAGGTRVAGKALEGAKVISELPEGVVYGGVGKVLAPVGKVPGISHGLAWAGEASEEAIKQLQLFRQRNALQTLGKAEATTGYRQGISPPETVYADPIAEAAANRAAGLAPEGGITPATVITPAASADIQAAAAQAVATGDLVETVGDALIARAQDGSFLVLDMIGNPWSPVPFRTLREAQDEARRLTAAGAQGIKRTTGLQPGSTIGLTRRQATAAATPGVPAAAATPPVPNRQLPGAPIVDQTTGRLGVDTPTGIEWFTSQEELDEFLRTGQRTIEPPFTTTARTAPELTPLEQRRAQMAGTPPPETPEPPVGGVGAVPPTEPIAPAGTAAAAPTAAPDQTVASAAGGARRVYIVKGPRGQDIPLNSQREVDYYMQTGEIPQVRDQPEIRMGPAEEPTVPPAEAAPTAPVETPYPELVAEGVAPDIEQMGGADAVMAGIDPDTSEFVVKGTDGWIRTLDGRRVAYGQIPGYVAPTPMPQVYERAGLTPGGTAETAADVVPEVAQAAPPRIEVSRPRSDKTGTRSTAVLRLGDEVGDPEFRLTIGSSRQAEGKIASKTDRVWGVTEELPPQSWSTRADARRETQWIRHGGGLTYAEAEQLARDTLTHRQEALDQLGDVSNFTKSQLGEGLRLGDAPPPLPSPAAATPTPTPEPPDPMIGFDEVSTGIGGRLGRFLDEAETDAVRSQYARAVEENGGQPLDFGQRRQIEDQLTPQFQEEALPTAPTPDVPIGDQAAAFLRGDPVPPAVMAPDELSDLFRRIDEHLESATGGSRGPVAGIPDNLGNDLPDDLHGVMFIEGIRPDGTSVVLGEVANPVPRGTGNAGDMLVNRDEAFRIADEMADLPDYETVRVRSLFLRSETDLPVADGSKWVESRWEQPGMGAPDVPLERFDDMPPRPDAALRGLADAFREQRRGPNWERRFRQLRASLSDDEAARFDAFFEGRPPAPAAAPAAAQLPAIDTTQYEHLGWMAPKEGGPRVQDRVLELAKRSPEDAANARAYLATYDDASRNVRGVLDELDEEAKPTRGAASLANRTEKEFYSARWRADNERLFREAFPGDTPPPPAYQYSDLSPLVNDKGEPIGRSLRDILPDDLRWSGEVNHNARKWWEGIHQTQHIAGDDLRRTAGDGWNALVERALGPDGLEAARIRATLFNIDTADLVDNPNFVNPLDLRADLKIMRAHIYDDVPLEVPQGMTKQTYADMLDTRSVQGVDQQTVHAVDDAVASGKRVVSVTDAPQKTEASKRAAKAAGVSPDPRYRSTVTFADGTTMEMSSKKRGDIDAAVARYRAIADALPPSAALPGDIRQVIPEPPPATVADAVADVADVADLAGDAGTSTARIVKQGKKNPIWVLRGADGTQISRHRSEASAIKKADDLGLSLGDGATVDAPLAPPAAPEQVIPSPEQIVPDPSGLQGLTPPPGQPRYTVSRRGDTWIANDTSMPGGYDGPFDKEADAVARVNQLNARQARAAVPDAVPEGPAAPLSDLERRRAQMAGQPADLGAPTVVPEVAAVPTELPPTAHPGFEAIRLRAEKDAGLREVGASDYLDKYKGPFPGLTKRALSQPSVDDAVSLLEQWGVERYGDRAAVVRGSQRVNRLGELVEPDRMIYEAGKNGRGWRILDGVIDGVRKEWEEGEASLRARVAAGEDIGIPDVVTAPPPTITAPLGETPTAAGAPPAPPGGPPTPPTAAGAPTPSDGTLPGPGEPRRAMSDTKIGSAQVTNVPEGFTPAAPADATLGTTPVALTSTTTQQGFVPRSNRLPSQGIGPIEEGAEQLEAVSGNFPGTQGRMVTVGGNRGAVRSLNDPDGITPFTDLDPLAVAQRQGDITDDQYKLLSERVSFGGKYKKLEDGTYELVENEQKRLADVFFEELIGGKSVEDAIGATIGRLSPDMPVYNRNLIVKGLRGLVRAAAAMTTFSREHLMFNALTGVRGVATDLIGDSWSQLTSGNVNAAVQAFNMANIKRVYKDVRTGSYDALAATDGGRTVSRLGLAAPTEAGFDIIGAKRFEAASAADGMARSGEMAPHRFVEKVSRSVGISEKTSHRLASLTAPLAVERLRDLRVAADIQRRWTVFSDTIARELPQTRDTFFSEVGMVGTKGGDSAALIRGLGDEFSPADVRRLGAEAGFSQGQAEQLARSWRSKTSGLERSALNEVKRTAFDFSATNADEVLRKVFMFHTWQTRAAPLYLRNTLKNPVLASTYGNIAEDLQRDCQMREGNQCGYLELWNTAAGMAMFASPAMLLSSALINLEPEQWQNPDATTLDRMLSKAPAMVNPVLQGIISGLGYSAVEAPDPFSTYTFRKFAGGAVDYARAHGWAGADKAVGQGDAFYTDALTNLYRAANEWSAKHLPGSKRIDMGDAHARDNEMIQSRIRDLVFKDFEVPAAITLEQLYDPNGPYVEAAAALDEAIMAWQKHEQNDYANQAFRDYTEGMAPRNVANIAIPGGVRVRSESQDMLARLRDRSKGSVQTGANAAAGQEARDTLGLGRVGSPTKLEVDRGQATVNAAGTEVGRAALRIYNAIAYGTDPNTVGESSFTTIGIRGQDMVAKSPEERKALADQWVLSTGNPQRTMATLEGQRAAEDAALAQAPADKAYRDWAHGAREMGADVFVEDMTRHNPSFAAYMEDYDSYANGLRESGVPEMDIPTQTEYGTTRNAYLASIGQKASVYDDRSLPTSTPGGGDYYPAAARDQGGTNGDFSKQTDSQALAADMARYQSDKMWFDLALQNFTGNPNASLEGMNPMLETAVKSKLAQAGISAPSKPRSVERFELWQAAQGPGEPTTQADYFAWRAQIVAMAPGVDVDMLLDAVLSGQGGSMAQGALSGESNIFAGTSLGDAPIPPAMAVP